MTEDTAGRLKYLDELRDTVEALHKLAPNMAVPMYGDALLRLIHDARAYAVAGGSK